LLFFINIKLWLYSFWITFQLSEYW
jgi:hypothetical protein